MARAITKAADVPRLMAEGVRQMAPVLVLFFAIAQFLAYFDWTHIGDVIAVNSAEALESTGVPIWAVFLAILALLSLVNVLVTSGSAMWALAAPIVAPPSSATAGPPVRMGGDEHDPAAASRHRAFTGIRSNGRPTVERISGHTVRCVIRACGGTAVRPKPSRLLPRFECD